MDFAWIRTFLKVVEVRSFTRASEALHLSQPAASRHVKKLEEELGVELIDRRYGNIELTPAGARFKDYATNALRAFESVKEEIQSDGVTLRGPLRIGASTIPGEFLAPDLAFRFAQMHPAVEPHIAIGDSVSIIEQLVAGRHDVGFVGARLSNREIQYRAIAHDEIVLAVPTWHHLAARNEIELEELQDQPFIEREPGSGTEISVRRSLSRYGEKAPQYRVIMRLSSTEAVLSAVERGHGIGWVSGLAVEHRRPLNVAAVRIAGVPIVRELYLALANNQKLPRAASCFVTWAQEVSGMEA
jgi:DNA-binding transcriptional LysR family regulator